MRFSAASSGVINPPSSSFFSSSKRFLIDASVGDFVAVVDGFVVVRC